MARRQICRKLLELQARQREAFKRELLKRGAEAILAEPNAEEQVDALGPDELPPGHMGFARTGLWD